MSNLIRTYGLDLPVYPPETEVVTNLGPFFIPPDQPRMLRSIFIWDTPGLPRQLSKLLQVADSSFDYAAELCGATTVDHKWGLLRNPSSGCEFTPPGFSLIANVAIIENTGHTETSSRRIGEGIANYQRDKKYLEYIWADCRHEQFTNGIVRQEAKPQLWLHDIDIYLDRNNKYD